MRNKINKGLLAIIMTFGFLASTSSFACWQNPDFHWSNGYYANHYYVYKVEPAYVCRMAGGYRSCRGHWVKPYVLCHECGWSREAPYAGCSRSCGGWVVHGYFGGCERR